MTGEIQFDSTSVDDLADVLSSASNGINEAISTLESQLDGVAWTGNAKMAYESAQSQWTAVMTELSSLLELAKKAANSASTQLIEADTAVTGLWSRG